MKDSSDGVAGGNVTGLLLAWSAGQTSALQRLVPLVFEDLHHRAALKLRSERADHTLQPTALINEVYLRLVDQDRVQWQNRAQFFGIAASLMRRVLVDHARRRAAAKRGDPALRVPLDEGEAGVPAREVDLLVLDQALHQLGHLDSRQKQVVELRYFGGLTIAETAHALEISPATVKNDWALARAFLFRELEAH